MTPSFANSWPWLFNTLNNAKVDNLTLRDALLDELRKQAGKQTKPKKTYAPTGLLTHSPYGGSQRIIKHQSLAAVALSEAAGNKPHLQGASRRGEILNRTWL